MPPSRVPDHAYRVAYRRLAERSPAPYCALRKPTAGCHLPPATGLPVSGANCRQQCPSRYSLLRAIEDIHRITGECGFKASLDPRRDRDRVRRSSPVRVAGNISPITSNIAALGSTWTGKPQPDSEALDRCDLPLGERNGRHGPPLGAMASAGATASAADIMAVGNPSSLLPRHRPCHVRRGTASTPGRRGCHQTPARGHLSKPAHNDATTPLAAAHFTDVRR
jgi:hypothetical protein